MIWNYIYTEQYQPFTHIGSEFLIFSNNINILIAIYFKKIKKIIDVIRFDFLKFKIDLSHLIEKHSETDLYLFEKCKTKFTIPYEFFGINTLNSISKFRNTMLKCFSKNNDEINSGILNKYINLFSYSTYWSCVHDNYIYNFINVGDEDVNSPFGL